MEHELFSYIDPREKGFASNFYAHRPRILFCVYLILFYVFFIFVLKQDFKDKPSSGTNTDCWETYSAI